jgi:chromosome segregation ATPase
MSPQTYKDALKEAQSEVADTVAELGEAEQKVQDLNVRIADLRQTVAILSKLCGEALVEVEDALGLTDAIRIALDESGGKEMHAQDVRLLLESRGFQTRRYGNLLASIHTVLKRLQARGEVKATRLVGDKQMYVCVKIRGV